MASLNIDFDLATEFFGQFARFGGTEQMLKQLLAEDNRMKEWVESLLVAAPFFHLTAFVSYTLPPYDELNGTTFNEANELYDGSYEWREHESVRGQVDYTPGEKNFLMKCFDEDTTREIPEGEITTDQVIAWAEANGYRAATHEEAVDFAKAHPNLQRQLWFIALGSFTMTYNDDRCVAWLRGDNDSRKLVGRSLTKEWHMRTRFLLVRK